MAAGIVLLEDELLREGEDGRTPRGTEVGSLHAETGQVEEEVGRKARDGGRATGIRDLATGGAGGGTDELRGEEGGDRCGEVEIGDGEG